MEPAIHRAGVEDFQMIYTSSMQRAMPCEMLGGQHEVKLMFQLSALFRHCFLTSTTCEKALRLECRYHDVDEVK